MHESEITVPRTTKDTENHEEHKIIALLFKLQTAYLFEDALNRKNKNTTCSLRLRIIPLRYYVTT